ncbi:MAG: choice-of-anchor tandem repeat GloVer-containing protein [Candidatus Sulfotelmatobacter sp.]
MKLIFCIPAVALCLCSFALSQATETVLYSFGAYPTDGTFPVGGLLFDSSGNIFGTTSGGGTYCQSNGGCGTIYELSPTIGVGWTETILYNFCPSGGTCPDGFTPFAGLIMDGAGNLYGTTASGGSGGVGTVFRLSPPSNGGSWTYTVLWNFAMRDPSNGDIPGYGKLNMDASGNIYGTTILGGAKDLGVVFELSPVVDGTYTFSILHSFSGSDGAEPQYGVAIDGAGNLYGTTEVGGIGRSICSQGGCGLVYELSRSTGAWQETVLYKFDGVKGQYPVTPISIDKFGDLYGTFEIGGGGSCFFGTCGGVFKLAPGASGNTGKKYTFYFNGGHAGGNPESGVLVESDNILYGTIGAVGPGNVYKLNYEHENILYNFCSLPNCADGSWPEVGTIVSHEGLLYGNTGLGGTNGVGVVYSLTK